MYVVLDTETTGLYPNRGHEIISYAGIKLDKNLNEIGRMHIKIQANMQNADPQALRVNRYKPKLWHGACNPDQAAIKIASFMRDCIPVAHNWDFDRSFILKLFADHAPHCKILRRGIDTIALASAALIPLGYTSMSMSSICKIFGWPKQTHEALDDTLMCVALFRLLYPHNIQNVFKVRIMIYRAKIGMYKNPLSQK
tara:strand:+ start:431 stop:1021 length:591 start_codon:yes stop_codon:yes gene_type:complete